MRKRITFTIAALLGLGTVAPAHAAPAAPRIATYNVFMLPRALYPNWGQEQRADLIVGQRVLSGQDVVVLNELFDNPAADRLLAGLDAEYPNRTPVVGRSKSGWDATEGAYSDLTPEDGGVAVVSRWPITRKVQHVYTHGCGADGAANKGFAYVRLSTPDGPLHVVGTHMQAEDPSCAKGEPAKLRAEQRGEINSFLAREVSRGERVYVAGDMNVIEASPEYRAMLDQLGAAAPTHTGHSYSWDCSDNSVCRGQYGDKYASEHLDYVLPLSATTSYTNETRRAKSPKWTVSSWGKEYSYEDYSDHYPVFGG